MGIIKYTEEKLRETAAISYSYTEWWRNLGREYGGGVDLQRLQIYSIRYNISTAHFTSVRKKGNKNRKITDELMFSTEYTINRSSGTVNRRVIERLIELGKPYQCDSCGINEWNNKPLRLQLEHIDGNNRNYVKDNLSFLCPNCHSQTATFSGKKNRKQKEQTIDANIN
jgi:ssDNA-binding Zn-finger/Zn-ribbon topoisomerase 1